MATYIYCKQIYDYQKARRLALEAEDARLWRDACRKLGSYFFIGDEWFYFNLGCEFSEHAKQLDEQALAILRGEEAGK